MVLAMAVYYVTMRLMAANLDVAKGESADTVYTRFGKPCGQAYFKCCGVEKDGAMANREEVWEQRYWLGSIRRHVYFNNDDQVVSVRKEFQWYFEPAMQGWVTPQGTCLQMMG